MAFSLDDAWRDTTGLLRTNASLLLPLGGAFILLPAIVTALALPDAPAAAEGATPGALITAFSDYFRANWPLVLLAQIVEALGAAAILALLLDRSRPTVAGAIGQGLRLLPFFFLLTVLVNLAVGAGLLLLIVPGLYLIGRLSPAQPAMVAERRRNPLDALGRSWTLTAGRGWRVFLMIAAVSLVGLVLSWVLTFVLGGVLRLLAGEAGPALVAVLGAVIGTVLQVILVVLLAGIYRQLTPAAVAEVFS